MSARCTLRRRRKRVQLGQQRQLHRQQAFIGGFDDAKRPGDIVLRLPREAQRCPQSPAQRIMGVEILHDLGPRPAIGLLERRDGIQFLRGRFKHLVRETVELVFDRLNGRGGVPDRGFPGLPRALVEGELASRLRVALGVQLRHVSRNASS